MIVCCIVEGTIVTRNVVIAVIAGTVETPGIMVCVCVCAAQLAGPNHSHTEQDRPLCVLERALPTELLRQLSWLDRITHTQSKTDHSVF